MLKVKVKLEMVWVRVRLRDVLLPTFRKEDTDHAKKKEEVTS